MSTAVAVIISVLVFGCIAYPFVRRMAGVRRESVRGRAEYADLDAEIENRVRELRESGACFCPRCGRKVNEADRFCAGCGASLRQE